MEKAQKRNFLNTSTHRNWWRWYHLRFCCSEKYIFRCNTHSDMDELDLARFEFKISFGWRSCNCPQTIDQNVNDYPGNRCLDVPSHQSTDCSVPMIWKHVPHYWHFVRGIHRSPVDSPRKAPVMQIFDDFFVLSLNKLWNKQSNFRWFETQTRLCGVAIMSPRIVPMNQTTHEITDIWNNLEQKAHVW